MELRTIPRILRIEGLIPFTISAIVLGWVVTLWETGYTGARWDLFAIAGVAALLIHIDGHIWNDIMDLEIDRFEKSKETGRDRPLVYGWATVGEYRQLSLGIMALVVVLAAYLATQRVLIPLLFVLGFFFDYGYNHPRLALAHHPFTEWYIFPWLVVGVTVTVVYAATGVLSILGFIIALLHGLMATGFVVSMMRRDARSDKRGGKWTTSVRYPDIPHATIYSIVTLIVAVLMLFPLVWILGNTNLAYILVLATALAAGVNGVLAARVDQLSTQALYSVFPDFEAVANRLMLRQAGVSLLYAAGITVILYVSGGFV